MSNPSKAFGRRLARVQGNVPVDGRLARQEAAVLDFARKLARGGNSRVGFIGFTGLLGARGWMLGGALASALLCAFTWLALRPSAQAPLVDPLASDVSGASAAAQNVAGDRTLTLADGSHVAIHGNSQVSVPDQPAVQLALMSGSVTVHVVKQHDRDWKLSAGPYTVAVVGTRFDVALDAVKDRVEVKVHEGVVRVFGKELPREGLTLTAQQSYASPEPPVAASAAEEQPLPTPEALRPASSVQPGKGARVNPSLEQDAPAGNEPTPWRRACAEGRYATAFPRALSSNYFEQTTQEELLELANCLRYAGRNAEAERALLRLRERFAGKPTAALASYHLARLAQKKGDRTAAIAWFETYLSEAGSGQLAAAARAELVTLWAQQGNQERARAMARDYLRLYPRGAFAARAQELLARESKP